MVPFIGLIRADFVWDDYELVVNNPLIRELTGKNLAAIFFQSHPLNYSPLVSLMFALEHLITKLDPSLYHLDNIVLHLLNTFLVYVFARALGMDGRGSWVVSALFAVHPVHVESVAWISQRRDLLYALFYWASAISYIYFTKEAKKRFYVLALLFFVGSLLSKPMAVTLPLVLLAYEFIYHKVSVKAVLRLAPFKILAVALGLYTLWAFQQDKAIRPEFMSWETWKLVAYCPVFYLQKCFFPVGLSSLYPFPFAGDAGYQWSVMIASGCLIAFFFFARKSRGAFFGGIFFLISVLPVIQLVPVGNTFAADRYLYVALFGILLAFADGLHRVEIKFPKLRAFLSAGVFLLVLLGFWLSWHRSQVWMNDTTLWTDVLKKNPDSTLAYYDRGRGHHIHGRLKEALADYEKALQLNPTHAGAEKNRGVVYGMMGEFEKARECFDRVIQAHPEDFEAYYNRAVAYAQEGDIPHARADFRRVLELKPGHEQASVHLKELS